MMKSLYEYLSVLCESCMACEKPAIAKRRQQTWFRRPMFEPLEDRRLLAIMWANEIGTNGFNIYGNDEVYARALVNRAIDDWDRVITDFKEKRGHSTFTRLA